MSVSYQCDAHYGVPPPQTPDGWLSRRGALRAAGCLVGFLVLWASASTLFDAGKTYRAKVAAEYTRVEQATNYFNAPKSMCRVDNADYRVTVGPDFDQCEKAKRIMHQRPEFEAFLSLLEEYQFCSGGKCMVFTVNIFSSLNLIFGALVLLLAVVGLVLGAKIVSFVYANFQQSDQLPLHLSATQLAALAAKTGAHAPPRTDPRRKKMF